MDNTEIQLSAIIERLDRIIELLERPTTVNYNITPEPLQMETVAGDIKTLSLLGCCPSLSGGNPDA